MISNDIENTTELKVAIHSSTLLHATLSQASRSTQSDSLLQRHKAKGPRVLGKPCFSSASHGINSSTWHRTSPHALAKVGIQLNRRGRRGRKESHCSSQVAKNAESRLTVTGKLRGGAMNSESLLLPCHKRDSKA